jgi:hypothetical protein
MRARSRVTGRASPGRMNAMTALRLPRPSVHQVLQPPRNRSSRPSVAHGVQDHFIGNARVSTNDQDAAVQEAKLRQAGLTYLNPLRFKSGWGDQWQSLPRANEFSDTSSM